MLIFCKDMIISLNFLEIIECVFKDCFVEGVDLLIEILLGLWFDGVEYVCYVLYEFWVVVFLVWCEVIFYFIVQGSCWMQVGQDDWLQLNVGDVVLLLCGLVYVLVSVCVLLMVEIGKLVCKVVVDNLFLVDDSVYV